MPSPATQPFRLAVLAVGLAAICIATPSPASELPLVAAVVSAGVGLIKPELQPVDLFERYRAVVTLTVATVDRAAHRVELRLQRVCKGAYAPTAVTLTVVGTQPLQAFAQLMGEGVAITAYIGTPRKSQEVLFYAGGEGRWQVGSLPDAANAARWEWTLDLGQLGDKSLFGTFNGAPERLAEMMADQADGRMYFPAVAIDHFKPDRVLGTLPGPARGVALYDFDGDGRPDVYACGIGGDRLYRQSAPGVFSDATDACGFTGKRSCSVNVADADGDGRADLLLDGVLWFQGPDGRFAPSDALGEAAGCDVLMSLFADVDADGYPDVLVSHRDGGLSLHRNPAGGRRPFRDATAESGLDRPACGAGGTGWVMAGDWTGDHRTTLFYATGRGLLLTADTSGRFAPTGSPLAYDFAAEGTQSGLTGAGCFAALWKPGRQDLLFTRDTGFAFAINAGEPTPMDGVQFGNELQIASQAQLPLIVEDLNADGNPDIYIGSRGGRPNLYYANRGYGSYMVPDRNAPEVFSGDAHRQGAWGLAAGDADGDGANDLLLGGVDGTVTLLLNDCLARRVPQEHPSPVDRALAGVRIVAIRVAGPVGVVGATVTVAAADGRIVARRDIGANVATGCRGPDTVSLALREPGAQRITVRWSDGVTRRWTVSTGADTPLVQHLIAERTGGEAP